ncbi:MAG: hypothetical protein COA96_05700 [SAR86 cluster bacterium]|uniref:YhdP central domain-containing protein n=1 Tax=SAR86 cluster bacterium TaxID=2030880 RepID=A0A2A5B438_9GAMM|nr:MAG: hypothetical protein COA96_05700 [SAR86 cluster bacterium]
MFISILKKVRQQVILLLIVTLVLIAAYVSAGRQFMPAISRYTDFFERQILESTGLRVTVDSLVGNFQGFNPIIQVNGLRFLVGDDVNNQDDPNSSALLFDSASLIVDIPRSIWQRKWVLEDFVIEKLELNVEQTESGSWQLRGLSTSGNSSLSLDDVYNSFLRFTQISLRNVTVNLLAFSGERISFINGLATIRNREQNHYLHANVNLEGNSQQLALSLEVSGDDLSGIDGDLHISIPESDYSSLFRNQDIAAMSIQQLFGGGEFWLSFDSGQVSQLVSQLKVNNITLGAEGSAPLTLTELSGKASLKRGTDQAFWELTLADMSVSWQELDWSSFNAHLNFIPQQSISVTADNIDISLLAQLAVKSGLLDANAQQQLEAYSPRGALENFSLYVPLLESSEENLLLKTNLHSVDVASVRGTPNMWGINGFVQLEFNSADRFAFGVAEVESDEFRINIPNVFLSTWDYNYVNGSFGFQLDLENGQDLKLVSNVIAAESDAVSGRVQFTATINKPVDGEPKAELELLVGALRFDGEQKSQYLPDGPNIDAGLRSSMEWIDRAVLDGQVLNSGVLYRGSTIPGAAAATKTFQSFYLLSNGELNFSDEWPDLSGLTAYIVTDDNNIDIEILSGQSMNIAASSVLADIRRDADGQTLLSLHGQASGSTADGLNYLQNSGVGDSLKAAFATWEAEGGFSSDIEVLVPLNSIESNPELETEVRLDINLADNKLLITDYAIDVEELSGSFVFDTRTGLERSEMTGRLFGQKSNLRLSSTLAEGELKTIIVDATGSVAPEQLIAWPLQSEFVQDILATMEGQLAYDAKLSIAMTSGSTGDATNSLLIDSSLIGASLSLPYPFSKPVEMEMPLHLELDFFGDNQHIYGTLGSKLSFDLDVEQGTIVDGLVLLGDSQSNFESLLGNDTKGLAVLGSMDRFRFEEWSSFLAEFNRSGSTSSELGNTIEFVDLQLDIFELYDTELDDVGMRIIGDVAQQQWLITLDSEAISGQVGLPFSSEGYIELDLDYLRLPGTEQDRIGPPQELTLEQIDADEQEAIDVLAQIDPRALPRMKFSTDEFRIGDKPYGSWRFTLNPNSTGAAFTDMAFDFRGLRLGMDGVDGETDGEEDELAQTNEAYFNWQFDGTEHHSELSGVLVADNMADVLTANGYAASFDSNTALFTTNIDWPGSPAFFAADHLSGDININIEDGRFLQGTGATGALKLISILNFDAIMRRLRFSDDLLRSGLAYDEITGQLSLNDGIVDIEERLVISGPSSLYQITGEIDLAKETITGEMFVTLPVSENIPWIGLLTANIPLAVGAYLFDRIFGNQVNSLTSAVYTLEGPWEDLDPQFKQAFGSPDDDQQSSVDAQ